MNENVAVVHTHTHGDIIKNRNEGLDILRIFSMIMILIQHYIDLGGLLKFENVGEINYVLYIFIRTITVVSVNCYVFISGYFLVKSEFKIKKFLKLWGEVIFYSITIYLILRVFGLIEFSLETAIKSFCPVLTKEYWFVSVYLALYILSPFLNKLINNIEKSEYTKLLLIIIVIFSILTLLPSDWTLDNTGGYGIIWFVCLYLISAYIRLYVTKEWIEKHHKKFLIVYLICSLVTTIGIIIVKMICKKIGMSDVSKTLWMYNSPINVIASLSLFLYFIPINLNNKNISKILVGIAPLTFSVYLIHQQIGLSSILYKEILHTEICYNNLYGVLILFASVIIIFLISIFIEYLRKKVTEILVKKYYKIKEGEK